ncbi:MAG: sigma-70 family RNA polymerase sigma factor, partial [Moorea sp. SIO2B7]|nr:sigma-70 family RNA polymerase sigma factor [Moorena sp. SIO2B7]
MNRFSMYTISTESPTQSNLRRLELLLEYCQLAARPTLSVSDSNRMAEILELAEADQISQAMTHINPTYQEVLSYRFLNSMDYDETAQALERKVNNVRVLQHRALSA